MTALVFSTLRRSARLPGDMLARAHSGTLAASAMNASAWTLLGFGIQYPLRLAGNLAMAHLLAPEAFGLMALVLTLHLGLSLLSDVGVGQSIMRDQEGDTPQFLRTAWVVQILRGVGLALCLILVAVFLREFGPPLAPPGTVYADTALPELIAASSAVVLIAGLQSTNLFLAVRRLEAKRHMMVELAAQCVALSVMVGLALAVPSVWALLAGAVASAMAKTALSHLVMKGPRMRWVWDPARVARLWRFGRWLIGASIGGFLITQGDKLVLSGILEAETLGVFAIAALWVEAGRQVLIKIASFVFVPSFSSVLRERPEQIGPIFRRALGFFSLACALVAALTAGVAFFALSHLYDARYAGAGAMAMVLSCRNLMLGFVVVEHFLLARADSRTVALAKLSGGVLAVVCLVAAHATFGMAGAVAAAACAGIPSAAVMLGHQEVRRHLDPRVGWLSLLAFAVICIMLAGYLVPA